MHVKHALYREIRGMPPSQIDSPRFLLADIQKQQSSVMHNLKHPVGMLQCKIVQCKICCELHLRSYISVNENVGIEGGLKGLYRNPQYV